MSEATRREETSTKQTEEELNSWLPITANREAKWWYSAFHNVTAMVGTGVLGLPYAMSQLGWVPGIIGITLSWLITLYTLWQLVELHEDVPGKRFDRYPELGEHAFGPKLGYWLIMPQQLAVQVATNIVYMVTGGKSLKKAWDLMVQHLANLRKTYFILMFAAVQMLLSQIPNFNSLKVISLIAAVMSFSYSAIACVTSIIFGVKNNHLSQPSYGVRGKTTAGIIFDVFNAIGTLAFSFAGHSIVLEVQATIPSTPEKPSNKPMWKGVVVAYIIVALCYFPVAIAGFWAYGNAVEDDILISLEHPPWLISLANFMVFLHVIGSWQVYAMMPVFDMLEAYLVKNLNFKPSTPLRLIGRSGYVALTAFVGICIPFFGGLLGFCGGLIFAPISYFVPCIMWQILRKPKRWSFHWYACWICNVLGVLVMLLSPIGGTREIVLSFKSYKFFS